MTINRTCLHAFHIVATEGSFSLAAEAHHVSQPTLSAQVKELETRYKVNLFERRGRGVDLTVLGQSLHEITQKIFALETQAEQLILSEESKISGILRIGADSPFLIIPLLKSFKEKFPEVKHHIEFANSKQLLESLKSRKFDLILLPDIKPGSQLYSQKLQSDRLIVFVDINHPWTKKSSVNLRDLMGRNIVLREKGSNTRSRFETILKNRNLQLDPDSVFVISSREGVREAVAAGFGVGIVSESEFGHDKRLHPLQIKDVKSRHTEFLVCLQKRYQEPILRNFFKAAN